jgi:hypothetical protein
MSIQTKRNTALLALTAVGVFVAANKLGGSARHQSIAEAVLLKADGHNSDLHQEQNRRYELLLFPPLQFILAKNRHGE